jgi:hypothetical protein
MGNGVRWDDANIDALLKKIRNDLIDMALMRKACPYDCSSFLPMQLLDENAKTLLNEYKSSPIERESYASLIIAITQIDNASFAMIDFNLFYSDLKKVIQNQLQKCG